LRHDMDMTEQPDGSSGVTRSVGDHIVAGVCLGLSDHFGVNVWWFRLAFVILAIFGFAGVFLYIVAWLLIPKETEDESIASSLVDRLDLTDVGSIFGVGLIALAGVVLLNQALHVSGTLVAAGVLLIIGVLLYRGDLHPSGDQRPSTQAADDDLLVDADPSPDDEEPQGRESADGGAQESGGAANAAVATKPKKVKVKRPRPPRSMLGRLTMAVALIVLSTMTLVSLAGWFTFQPVNYLAAGMGVIALGLLVGAWIGRARWLIIVGILLAPWVFFAALLPPVPEWSVGVPIHRPQTIDAVEDAYSLTLGQLFLDLTDLSEQDFASIGKVEASVGAGQLIVRVPLGVGVLVRAEVAVGTIQSHVSFEEVFATPLPEVCVSDGLDVHRCVDLFTSDQWRGEFPWQAYRNDSGIALDRTFSVGTEPIVLELNLSVGAGEIRVQQIGLPIIDSGVEG